MGRRTDPRCAKVSHELERVVLDEIPAAKVTVSVRGGESHGVSERWMYQKMTYGISAAPSQSRLRE